MHSTCQSVPNQTSSPPRITWQRLLLSAAVLAVLLVTIGVITAGKSGAEKTIVRLSQPIGFGWLFFTAYCLQLSVVSGVRMAIAPWLIWFAMMIFTTSPFAEWCIYRLESSVEAYRPERDGHLAAVVVLGGGAHQGPWRPELSCAGDRIAYAAQLYLQNHTRRLVTTGEATTGISRETTSPRELTTELWTQLKIPEGAIDGLQGQNTYQEIQNLKICIDQYKGGRVGILTSALHLPRAMRLAKAEGLDVVPLAADHLSSSQPFTYLDFIPSAAPLSQLAACQNEIMAWFVGR